MAMAMPMAYGSPRQSSMNWTTKFATGHRRGRGRGLRRELELELERGLQLLFQLEAQLPAPNAQHPTPVLCLSQLQYWCWGSAYIVHYSWKITYFSIVGPPLRMAFGIVVATAAMQS